MRRATRLPGAGLQVAAELRGVTVRRGGAPVLMDVDLDVRSGELLAVVGPNGAGKSTLLAVLAGDLSPSSGDVLLDGSALGSWSVPELAVRRTVLVQQPAAAFGFTARQVVEMGRHPWAGTPEAGLDEVVVAQSMAGVDVTELAGRQLVSLSGGEQARVHLARAIAQDTHVVLLDEPTAALDLKHAERLMLLARALADAGRAVLVVVHALDLAGAHADRVAVLAAGRVLGLGPVSEVLTQQLLSEAYDSPIEVIAHPRTGRPVVLARR